MSFDRKRKLRHRLGNKGNHRNIQILRPGSKRAARAAMKLALEQRDESGRASSNGDKRSLLNDAIEKRICGFLRAGASLEDAALLSGLGSRVVTTWRTKGAEDPASRYGQFLENTEVARCEWKVSTIKKITASPDWKAHWKMLCSRFPLEFRNITAAELSGPDGGPIQTLGGSFNVVLELANKEEKDEHEFRIEGPANPQQS